VSWQTVWVHGVHLSKKKIIASSDLRYGIRSTTSLCLAIYASVAVGDESAMNLRGRMSVFEISVASWERTSENAVNTKFAEFFF
jgi:hypothetical protein